VVELNSTKNGARSPYVVHHPVVGLKHVISKLKISVESVAKSKIGWMMFHAQINWT